MFYYDENLTINLNFRNNLMFFVGLPLLYCVRIYSFDKLVLLALIVLDYTDNINNRSATHKGSHSISCSICSILSLYYPVLLRCCTWILCG